VRDPGLDGGEIMEQTSNGVEQKIIDAAITCVEKYGINGTTNRRIAEIAKVNSAAINYYFRSKEVLIDRVMKITLDNAFDWNDIEILPSRNALERCIAVFEHIIEGACNFPGITRAHFYDLLIEGKEDSPAVERLNQFLVRLSEDLKEKGSNLSAKELRLATFQIASACLMISIAPRAFRQGARLDMNDPKSRQEFVTRLVTKLLS
jgi:AcrR family transcriptional regulator